MNFVDVFQEIFRKNNEGNYSQFNMYFVSGIEYADTNYQQLMGKEVEILNRKEEQWISYYTQFLTDNNVEQEAIKAAKQAILDAVDYLKPIEVS